MDQDNNGYYHRNNSRRKDWSIHKTEKTDADDIIVYEYVDDNSFSSSDDSPLINYKYKKRFAPYVPAKGADIPLLNGRERERRWSFGVLAKFFFFCTAMILFCVLMYIPVYNRVNEQMPKGVVAGWSTHTNRDTKIYVQPNNLTTINEPKDVCTEDLFLLIIVSSATQNFKQRNAIRNTWGDYQNYNKMNDLFGKIHLKYSSYNFSYDLYPYNSYNLGKRKQRSASFGAILPNLALALRDEIKKEKVDDNIFFNFNMNKELNYGDYDYESNIMRIPPKDLDYRDNLELSSKLEKIISIIKSNVTEEGDTEAAEKHVFKLVFILGLPADNDTQVKVDEEISKYGDIIQEDFIDSYNNLTLKSVMMLKWVINHCQDSVRYILKTDDDMFINTPNLISTLKNKSVEFEKKKKGDEKEILLIGDLIYGAKPVSDSHNKWYSPKYMYSGRVYPKYLSGTGYALSIHTAKVLYEAALRTPFFHLEDIYITGLCASRARPRIRAQDDSGFTYEVSPVIEPCAVYRHVTSHRVPHSSLRSIIEELMTEKTVDVCERIRLTKIRRDRMRPKTTRKTLKFIHH